MPRSACRPLSCQACRCRFRSCCCHNSICSSGRIGMSSIRCIPSWVSMMTGWRWMMGLEKLQAGTYPGCCMHYRSGRNHRSRRSRQPRIVLLRNQGRTPHCTGRSPSRSCLRGSCRTILRSRHRRKPCRRMKGRMKRRIALGSCRCCRPSRRRRCPRSCQSRIVCPRTMVCKRTGPGCCRC